MTLSHDYLRDLVSLALAEDVGDGDISTFVAVSQHADAQGIFVAREPLVVAGLLLLKEVYRQIDPCIVIVPKVSDGAYVERGTHIAAVSGPARGILTGERVALNYMQRLSGVATMTKRFVDQVRDTQAVILDTRKTIPGFRLLEKYAVALGGGTNHRFGLYDHFMFKDNHLAVAVTNMAAEISDIIKRARAYKPDAMIEIEVDTLEQLKSVLKASPDRILLDNFSLSDLASAVQYVNGAVFLEASGGVTLETVRDIAKTGVDGISVGALTHSVKATDIALDINL